jgi:hypothetical protein
LILPRFAVFLVLALLAGPSRAGDSVAIEILEYGLFTSEEVAPSTGVYETMRSATVTKVCHVMTTSTVSAGGGEFGLRYRVLGSPAGRPVGITHVLIYPDARIPTDSPVFYVTNRQDERLVTGSTGYRGWANRRTRPGTWTFQIWEKDRMLAETVFTVVEKSAFKVRPDGDSSCFVLSNLQGATQWHST